MGPSLMWLNLNRHRQPWPRRGINGIGMAKAVRVEAKLASH